MALAMTDVRLTNHGSLIGFELVSEAAREWADDHLPDDAPRWGGAVMVEPRYADQIIEGMQDDGLTVD